MKLTSHPVLDRGETYPHHNLYYLTSRVWDLEVLGGLLLRERLRQAFRRRDADAATKAAAEAYGI